MLNKSTLQEASKTSRTLSRSDLTDNEFTLEFDMTKCCDTCLFYRAPKGDDTRGTCIYPVPEWLMIGASGGGFIGNPEYEGTDCRVYKSAAETTAAQGGQTA